MRIFFTSSFPISGNSWLRWVSKVEQLVAPARLRQPAEKAHTVFHRRHPSSSRTTTATTATTAATATSVSAATKEPVGRYLASQRGWTWNGKNNCFFKQTITQGITMS